MDLTIQATFLPHADPDASVAFYRDTLGFEVRNQVGYGGKRWITVGPPASPARPSSCTRPPSAPAQSPTTTQPYGVRDCAFRDPAGNLIRINELR